MRCSELVLRASTGLNNILTTPGTRHKHYGMPPPREYALGYGECGGEPPQGYDGLPYLDGATTGYSSIRFKIDRFVPVSEPSNGALELLDPISKAAGGIQFETGCTRRSGRSR